MRLAAVASLIASLSLTAVISGCSTEAGPDDAQSEQDLTAASACTPAQYEQALAHYKNAVEWSKDRLSHGVCESEMGYHWMIADEASRAVMTCGAFRETIKSSPWAAPLREVLSNSLTLASLTGDLLVIKDSVHQNWRGTEQLLPGVSFWARAQGAYGWPYQIDFHADGKATWGYLHYDEASGDITWKTMPATYTVTKIDGTEKGKRLITVNRGDVTELFELGVQDAEEYKAAPIFTLTPGNDEQPTQQVLYSSMDECDA